MLFHSLIIMQRRRDPCSHIRSLSRDAVLKSTTTELSRHCHIHTNIPTYYLCLHCAEPLCLQFQGEQACLQYHYFRHPTHLFCLQIEQGAVWCHSCSDTIQNQLFDYGPHDKDESVMKLRRFEKYIADLWQELLKKSNVKPIGSSHRGIKNLGNTCFLSVVLQSLYATIPLRELYERVDVKEERMFLQERTITKEVEYFYDDVISKHESQQWNIVSNKKERSKQESMKPFTNTIKNAKFNVLIRDFLQSMSNSPEGAFIPSKILNAISQFNVKYHENKEQDAEQLLLLILDAMNEGERISFLRDLQRYKQAQGILGFQKLTPIQNIFSFYLLNEIQCSSCKEVSRSLNLAYSIPLAVGGDREKEDSEHASGRVTIDYWQELSYPQNLSCCPLIASFFDTERLCKANNYYECQKCRSLLAYRKYYLVSEPKVLMLSFKRFNAKLQKKAVRVQFPLQLTLEGVSLDSAHGTYSLYAVIVHEGDSLATGHYICFVRLEGQWLLCSDEKVQRVSHKEVLSQQPYVLLYQRQ